MLFGHTKIFQLKKNIDVLLPKGKASIYTKGLVEAISSSAQSSVYSTIEFVKSMGSPKKGESIC